MVEINCVCGHSWMHDFMVVSSIEACPKCKTWYKIEKLGRFRWKSEPVSMKVSSLEGLFESLNLHPVIKKVSGKLFKDGHYESAIFEAYKAIEVHVKKKSGVTNREGKDLMAYVFKRDNPVIRLNPLNTRSDRDEQEGFQFIFMGAMIGIRNPKAHDLIVQNDAHRTLEYLSLASLLLKRLHEGVIRLGAKKP